MARVVPSSFSRKLLIASLVFGLFVLCDITLFGWLIFRSLSQREIERVLLETRSEAEKLAQQIARRAEREKDLYTAVAVERETQTYLIGVVSMLLLVSAYAAVWMVLRRSQRLEVQAAQAERLAYLGTLASGLAHEIRNPLNSLNLNMQMLEEEIDEHGSAPTGKRLLSITRSEISRLERLATDFLAYAKPRPLELEEIPAVRLLERVPQVLEGEIRKRRAQVVVEDRSGGARVRVDAAQIGQLLLNLTQNAFAATEESGRPPVVRLTAERRGVSVLLDVRDNGTGIPPGEQPKIFDLFYSTRKGGTGLGLAIADRIARAHGGRLAVDSTPGEGTVMTVELPAVTTPEPAVGPRKAEAPPEGGASTAVV